MTLTKEQQTADRLLAVFPLIKRKLMPPMQVLHCEGLHHTHFIILRMLQEKHNIRPTDLAKEMGIQKSNITPLLNKILEHKLIEKRRDEKDKRVMYVLLTEAGERFLQEQNGLFHESVAGKLQSLEAGDLDTLSTAVHSLEKILLKIEEE